MTLGLRLATVTPHRPLPLAVRLTVACLAAIAAFTLYAGTLLPGQDLGDTASFQAIAGDSSHTARQGYPLYFAILRTFVRSLPVAQAKATNLASAVEAAAAIGLVVLVGAELAGGALLAGLVAAALFAGSYTFWSQAIIAEVYALHAFVVSGCLLALLAWARRPSLWRLGVFFGLYALGFGNHLSMILVLPAFTIFLLASAPGGPLTLLRPKVVALALGLAAIGALQYWGNLASLIAEGEHSSIVDLLTSFWFDVTKTDWRVNMVATVSASTLSDRSAMYWFDLVQQFGVTGVVLAVVGLFSLARTRWRVALLVGLSWLVTWLFAFTYNVGDTHVFYLSSHLFVALAVAPGAACVVRLVRHGTATFAPASPDRATVVATAFWLATLAYPGWRIYDAFPALDRSHDWAPTRFFDQLTAGLDERHEILGADMNWQVHNGLDYYERHTKSGLIVFDVPTTLLHFPLVARQNFLMGRSIALTAGSASMVQAAFGPLFSIERDDRVATPSLDEQLASLPPGTPYVLTLIQPYPESPVSRTDLDSAARRLGLPASDLAAGRYLIITGEVGHAATVRRSGDWPFRLHAQIQGLAIDTRIEAWIPTDTIRRQGFGHVIVNRRHVFTLDRGLSFVALARDGSARFSTWVGGVLTPEPRFIIRPPSS
jgi:hypothetical protein